MENRIEPRIKKRMACAVTVGGRRHSGIVLDLSSRGMFIQTHAKPRLGAEAEVELSVPTQREKLLLHTTVTRKRIVPAQLLTVAQGGIGVEIRNAPEAYYALLAAITPGNAGPSRRSSRAPAPPAKDDPAPANEPTDAQLTQFRVWVSEVGSSRSRRFFVTSASEEEARNRVRAELGEAWKILQVERV